MFKLTWNEHAQQVASIEEVDRALDLLHEQFSKGHPAVVTVQRSDNEDMLAVGLGLPLSILDYTPGNLDPPYYGSHNSSYSGNDLIEFWFSGELTEFHMRQAIPIALARRAVSHFCETGKLLDAVEWEQA